MEDFWSVEGGDFGGVPGGENVFVFTDDVDKVVITLGVNLDVVKKLQLVGLQGFNHLLFEG